MMEATRQCERSKCTKAGGRGGRGGGIGPGGGGVKTEILIRCRRQAKGGKAGECMNHPFSFRA